MKVYGKVKKQFEEPSVLEEVTLVVSLEETMELIRFLSACVSGMTADRKWEHMHLQDFIGEKNALPDLIIFAGTKAQ